MSKRKMSVDRLIQLSRTQRKLQNLVQYCKISSDIFSTMGNNKDAAQHLAKAKKAAKVLQIVIRQWEYKSAWLQFVGLTEEEEQKLAANCWHSWRQETMTALHLF